MDRKILYLFYSFNPTSVAILQSLPRAAFPPHPAMDCGPFQPFHVAPPLRTMLWTVVSGLWSVPAIPLTPSSPHYAVDRHQWTVVRSNHSTYTLLSALCCGPWTVDRGLILHLPCQRARAQNSRIAFLQLREHQLHFILENGQQVQLHMFPYRFHDQVTGFG